MKMIGFRSQKNPPAFIPAGMPAQEHIIISEWWYRTYAPLFWASRQSWGGPIVEYWSLFPIRREPEETP